MVYHAYKDRVDGRSFRTDPKTGVKAARVECSQCGSGSRFSCVKLPPPDILDKKFTQRGWQLDPNVCPTCLEANKRAKTEAKATAKEQKVMLNVVNSNGTLADNPTLKAVSSNTHKATAKMHQLLSLHFDEEAGKFADGWDDERIAKDSGLSPTHVAEVRVIAYGELKEPEELTALRSDIKALNELITETLITAQKEVNALNNRIADITKKLGVKL